MVNIKPFKVRSFLCFHVKRITNSINFPAVGSELIAYIVITTHEVIINLVHSEMFHFALVETFKIPISLKYVVRL